MTISILAFDEKTGRMGGAAATGSLCVGGWVLRGHPESGMSASQGTAPSTLWGEGVLASMADGLRAADAVAAVTGSDSGRAHRQLAALDRFGGTAAFTGAASIAHAGSQDAAGLVVAGNMLAGPQVIAAAVAGFHAAAAMPFAERLMGALGAAAAAGGDARGLKSAALLVVGRDMAPLTLRIDHSVNPLAALADLYRVSQGEPYHGWTEVVPVLDDPYRAPAPEQVPDLPEPIIEGGPAIRR
ncbi:DUF1028 domain-containing protein [Roseicyclus mahoneyensis]|uniref:Putative Ntn-hydrolase superfamily protein n=1 Tax=Roseicyclus mahoneyensis TaxID=164332 RepID=A0A316GD29_9RHOB|nr:DUF1028 domain-containing protein [Roseicyclus mahoneyensis]PWK58115.1 putative Ntn-hydrolase superfamily protein [Roseicyclus mahoneyensis]